MPSSGTNKTLEKRPDLEHRSRSTGARSLVCSASCSSRLRQLHCAYLFTHTLIFMLAPIPGHLVPITPTPTAPPPSNSYRLLAGAMFKYAIRIVSCVRFSRSDCHAGPGKGEPVRRTHPVTTTSQTDLKNVSNLSESQMAISKSS